jgi:hypothetical protein
VQNAIDKMIFTDNAKTTYARQFPIINSSQMLDTLNDFYRTLEATLDSETHYHQLPPYQPNKT